MIALRIGRGKDGISPMARIIYRLARRAPARGKEIALVEVAAQEHQRFAVLDAGKIASREEVCRVFTHIIYLFIYSFLL